MMTVNGEVSTALSAEARAADLISLAYLVRSHDTFGKPKTGEFLWELAQDDIDYMRREYGIDLIGLCTDDGPDGKGMQRRARTDLPWLIVLLCWAHQNQLIIGDLIKRNPALKALLNRALDLIKWFLNHSVALALLHKEQELRSLTHKAVTLLLPVVSRWGAHYVSISRLLRLKDYIRPLCVAESATLLKIQTRADSEESSATRMMSAQEVLDLVADRNFWMELER